MIYLDGTAMLKLIIKSHESTALTTYLRDHTNTRWFTCSITRIELHTATESLPTAATEHAQATLAGLDIVAVTDRLINVATELTPAPPRTIDALHLAAALTAGPRLQALVTYDDQLAAQAAVHQIPVICPGGGSS